jgi:hypothetical protein
MFERSLCYAMLSYINLCYTSLYYIMLCSLRYLMLQTRGGRDEDWLEPSRLAAPQPALGRVPKETVGPKHKEGF